MRSESKDFDPSRARNFAIRCLARREHSSAELHHKLVTKGCAQDIATQVIERLQTERLLSDDRFIESFISARQRRGQGPLRVRQELGRKGIPKDAIDRWFGKNRDQWSEIVKRVQRRKFGAKRPRTPSERAKQIRFLRYRGFSFDQIQQVLKARDND